LFDQVLATMPSNALVLLNETEGGLSVRIQLHLLGIT
jgi:hypothetical protein